MDRAAVACHYERGRVTAFRGNDVRSDNRDSCQTDFRLAGCWFGKLDGFVSTQSPAVESQVIDSTNHAEWSAAVSVLTVVEACAEIDLTDSVLVGPTDPRAFAAAKLFAVQVRDQCVGLNAASAVERNRQRVPLARFDHVGAQERAAPARRIVPTADVQPSAVDVGVQALGPVALFEDDLLA